MSRCMIPNNCDEDIPEECNDFRRGPLRIEDFPVSILQQTEDYLIINKPWDVRMYGDFSVTVEKLVSAWTGRDRGLKWVHRLDYATSGILCIGLTSKFAAAASWSFEKRMVTKKYLAVLQGIVNPENYPTLLHLNFQNSQRKRKSVEINDQSSWQSQALYEGLEIHLRALSELTAESPNFTSSMSQELRELQAFTFIEYSQNNKLRKRLRKFLKSLGLLQSVVSEKSAYVDSSSPDEKFSMLPNASAPTSNIIVWNQENYAYRLSTDQLTYLNELGKYKMEGQSIPDVFLSGQKNSGNLTNVIWVDAPIQDIPGDFRMCIPDRMNGENGRNCETKIEILNYGTYQNKPVTKVLLSPVSGRRHQLRLHCLALGHPIVGDATYGSLGDDDQSERMMLHAHRLEIRLKYKGIDSRVEGEANDPFPFDHDGNLTVG